VELLPVQSSNVAAAGYLEVDQIMMVRYNDGALYAFPGVTAEAWASFEQAPSKGVWLKAWTDGGGQAPSLLQKQVVRPGTGGAGAAIDPAAGASVSTAASVSLLQTYQDDDCCGRLLVRFLQTTAALQAVSWKCPKCEMEWTHRMHGSVRHWFPRVNTMVMRRRV
jgi:hypothetical protein